MERHAAVTVGGFGLWAALLLLLWGAAPSAAAGDSQPPSSLTVGVVQLALEPTLEQNREKIAGFIREAKDRDCRVVVFPETALYAPPDTPKAGIDAAVAGLQAVINDCNLYCILVGMYHDHDGDRPFNRLLVIDPEGEIIQTYHKMWHDNRSNVAPGLFPIDGVPCAATICADRWIRSVEELPAFAGGKILFECSDRNENRRGADGVFPTAPRQCGEDRGFDPPQPSGRTSSCFPNWQSRVHRTPTLWGRWRTGRTCSADRMVWWW